MGRPSKTASSINTAPPAQASAKPSVVVAYGPPKGVSDEDSKRSEANLTSVFESMVIPTGASEEKKPEAKQEKPDDQPQNLEIDDDEGEGESPKAKKEEKPKSEKAKAVLPDEDEDDDADPSDDEDEPEPDGKVKKQDKDIADKLFKARERKRELKAKVAAAEARAAELESKLNGVVTASAPTGELFTGIFENVKTPGDVEKVKDGLQKWVEFLEDNSDGYTNGETEVDAKEAKAQLRFYRAELKKADKVDKFFETRDKSAAKAKELYPWVSNTSSKRHDLVLDIAKEYPEVSRSAHSALLLGRLSIATLVESGEYTLVKKGATTPAAKEKANPKPSSRDTEERAEPVRQQPAQRQARPTTEDLETRFMRLLG